MNSIAKGISALALVATSGPLLAEDETKITEKGETLICKKHGEVGSLVRKRKQCMTAADWERVTQSQQDGARRTMDQLTERSGCAPPNPC